MTDEEIRVTKDNITVAITLIESLRLNEAFNRGLDAQARAISSKLNEISLSLDGLSTFNISQQSEFNKTRQEGKKEESKEGKLDPETQKLINQYKDK